MRPLVIAVAAVAVLGCGDAGELGELREVTFFTGRLCFGCDEIHGIALGAEVEVGVSIPDVADDSGTAGCPGSISYEVDGDALRIRRR
jgi:hypothetical protein